MSFWSITTVLVSIAFLVYRHHVKMLEYLPQWLRGGSTADSQAALPGNAEPKESSEPEFKVQFHKEDIADAETTPKAVTVDPSINVPDISLDGGSHERTKPHSPQANGKMSATNAKPFSTMLPPPQPRTSTNQSNSAGLMPPPSRPSMAPPPSSASALRVPSNGPLPNRGIPSNSQQRVSGTKSLAPTTTTSTPNPRGKVLLSPGHSPMDWAALVRRSNLSGVTTFQRVTPSMLKSMTGRRGKPAWSSWQGKVYNITPYLDFHPGGRDELMKGAGRDGTKLFMEVHPWVNWENMLASCMVGVLVPEEAGNGESELEEID